MTELCELFYKYKSDKCPKIFHSYSPKYYEILKDYKESFKYILEIGVGTKEIMVPISGLDYQIGSSLRSWRDFFVNSFVFGLDINEDVLFEDKRIKCFYTDQSNSTSLINTIENINEFKSKKISYDLIIDDGSHNIDHMVLTFNTLKKFLCNGGLYIIEDIKLKDLEYFKTLSCDNYEIIYSHDGNFEWDSFLVFKKNDI